MFLSGHFHKHIQPIYKKLHLNTDYINLQLQGNQTQTNKNQPGHISSCSSHNSPCTVHAEVTGVVWASNTMLKYSYTAKIKCQTQQKHKSLSLKADHQIISRKCCTVVSALHSNTATQLSYSAA